MISDRKAASAVLAKTARACDSCVRKRARWYCAADDAFLCQVCDGSVHSANPLARRHERVRLKTAPALSGEPCLPTWHRGPTKKGRTPRNRKQQQLIVPEHDSSTSQEDGHEEEQLLYRVPVYDPFVTELSGSTVTTSTNELGVGFDASDFDMDEFGVDVETLLGKGLEGESYGIEELGLLGCEEVKDEVMREPLELNFNYESSTTCDGVVINGEQVVKEKARYERGNGEKREWNMSLRLDYDAISEAWANQGSPWMNGKRPNIIVDDCWTQTSVGACGAYGELGFIREQLASSGDGGREARVLRYREKRRTRLFSKKIRYEVRKLNAEKRPRMKGRFVKRSSFTPTPFPLLRQ